MQLFKRLFFLLFLLCCFTCFSQQTSFDPAQKFSVEQLRKDFNFLRTKLEKKHPALYLYTPKARLDTVFDSLYKNITSPLTAEAFYYHISFLHSIIKDGHTMLLPGEELTNYYNQHEKFLPYFFLLTGDKLYIRMNCAADSIIKEGTEIISINGIKTTDLLAQLTARQIRDGYSNTYPAWILTNYFKEYYGFSFGHPEVYTIRYKNKGAEQKAIINALSKDSIAFYKKLRYPAQAALTKQGKGIVLDISKPQHTAVLTIKSFDNDILKDVYQQDFNNSISKAFTEIRNNNIDNLILDLRDNQGGDFKPGVTLLSHLLKQPIHFLPGSTQSRVINPVKSAYNGNVYVLINGGSFSNSGIICSYLEFTKRAVFIGEESAGGHILINGEPRDFILPGTKIIAEISTQPFRIRQQENDGRGIIPAYTIMPSIEDIINGKDPVKEFAFSLIAK
ncbi:S41 family peptidase [Ferruginibacter sp.]